MLHPPATATQRHMLRRFFHNAQEFVEELALYRDPVLQQALPQLIHASDNAGSAVRSRSGYAFPPFVVLERGLTLKEWVKQERSFGEIMSMVEHLAHLLNVLHTSGRVHRDLKPLNILYLLQSTQWRLLDLGIAAKVGASLLVLLRLPLFPDIHRTRVR